MFRLLTISIIFAGSCFAFAKTPAVDWKVCDKEIKEFCTTASSDQEKHECLEEAPKAKVAKACRDFNAKLGGKFGDSHGHKH